MNFQFNNFFQPTRRITPRLTTHVPKCNVHTHSTHRIRPTRTTRFALEEINGSPHHNHHQHHHQDTAALHPPHRQNPHLTPIAPRNILLNPSQHPVPTPEINHQTHNNTNRHLKLTRNKPHHPHHKPPQQISPHTQQKHHHNHQFEKHPGQARNISVLVQATQYQNSTQSSVSLNTPT